jgi:hypothetical protein
MAYGQPGVESFRRVITKSRNYHFVALMSQLKVFRQEVVSNDDLKNRGGLDTTTQQHFLTHLAMVDKLRRRVTYNPEGLDVKSILPAVIDVDNNVTTDPLGKTASGDVVQGQSGAEFDLPFHFDGTDPDFPPHSKIQLESPLGVGTVGLIDQSFVVISRLESRHRTKYVYYEDSMRIYQMLEMIFEELKFLGGDENRVDIANPLASDEPLGVDSSPNRVSGN